MTSLKLTPYGDFARRHGVLTPAQYWVKLTKEVQRIQDQGGEWQMLLEERAAGMLELARRLEEEGEPRYWRDLSSTDGESAEHQETSSSSLSKLEHPE